MMQLSKRVDEAHVLGRTEAISAQAEKDSLEMSALLEPAHQYSPELASKRPIHDLVNADPTAKFPEPPLESETLPRDWNPARTNSKDPKWKSLTGMTVNFNDTTKKLHALHRLAEAEQLIRDMLAWDEATLEETHPNILAGYNNLSLALRDAGRLDEANDCQREALIRYKAYVELTCNLPPYFKHLKQNFITLRLKMGDIEAFAQKRFFKLTDPPR